ncbi:MAG: hypothetical protein FK730_14440 [Asgard group archaeon]|nr:hypothetical protein [Asgard group archaeon]
MQKVLVKKNHESTDSDSLSVKAGDILQGEEKPTKFSNWIWCKDANDVYSWVPKSYLKPLADNPGYFKILKDYIAKELTVKIGDEVVILFKASEWAWVRTQIGEEGWIPLEKLYL